MCNLAQVRQATGASSEGNLAESMGQTRTPGTPLERGMAESMGAGLSSWVFAELQEVTVCPKAAPGKNIGLFWGGLGFPGLCSRGIIVSWVLPVLKTEC